MTCQLWSHRLLLRQALLLACCSGHFVLHRLQQLVVLISLLKRLVHRPPLSRPHTFFGLWVSAGPAVVLLSVLQRPRQTLRLKQRHDRLGW